MLRRTDFQIIVQIGLIKEIATLGGVVVSAEVDTSPVGINCARNKVLVEPVVVAEQSVIANVQFSGLMLNHSGNEIYACPDSTLIGVAEERGDVYIGWSASERRDSAISNPAISKMFVAQS